MVEWPQTDARMVPACEALYDAVVRQKLQHPNNPDLNRHVAHAVAKQTKRGWRLDKSERGAQIDAVVALAMAVSEAMQPQQEVRFVGFLGDILRRRRPELPKE